MIGTASLFGLNGDPMGLTPQLAPIAPVPVQTQAAQPFVWGNAGDRVSQDELARQQAIASREAATGMDFSPVGSWSLGAARVAQALLGAFDQKAIDKADAANQLAGQQALSAITGGSANDQAIASILADNTLPQGVRDVAKMQYEASHKAPPAPNDFERALQAAGVIPGTPEYARLNRQRADNLADPTMTTPLPGGGVYVGPRSQFQATIAGGGGPASTAGSVAPPATLPPDFDFGTGGPTHPASATFPDPMKAPGTMTSGRRTVEGNRLVGGVPTSHHLDGDAADYANTSVAALRAYFGNGARYLNEGSHIHVTLPGYGQVPYFGARGTAGL